MKKNIIIIILSILLLISLSLSIYIIDNIRPMQETNSKAVPITPVYSFVISNTSDKLIFTACNADGIIKYEYIYTFENDKVICSEHFEYFSNKFYAKDLMKFNYKSEKGAKRIDNMITYTSTDNNGLSRSEIQNNIENYAKILNATIIK